MMEMVVKLARGSTGNLKKFLGKFSITVGNCFDELEFTSILRSINAKYSNEYWLLGWREHRVTDSSSVFTVTVIDGHDKEYAVSIYVRTNTITVTLPAEHLDLADDTTGVTITIDGDLASLSGRILCITGIKVREIP